MITPLEGDLTFEKTIEPLPLRKDKGFTRAKSFEYEDGSPIRKKSIKPFSLSPNEQKEDKISKTDFQQMSGVASMRKSIPHQHTLDL